MQYKYFIDGKNRNVRITNDSYGILFSFKTKPFEALI